MTPDNEKQETYDKLLNICKIHSRQLLDDLVNWSERENHAQFARKVLRVYGKCLRQKHFELAALICKKYNEYFIQAPKSDLAMAFGYALMAQNKQEDTK